MKRAILRVLLFCTAPTVFSDGRENEPKTVYPYFHGRGHLWNWDVTFAKQEAEDDIRKGTLKVYIGEVLTGGDGLVGVPWQLYALVNKCVRVHPGFTDTISRDEERLRRDQPEYARVYNQTIVRHLLVRTGQSESRLEDTLADQAGERSAQERIVRTAIQKMEERKRKKWANKSPEPTPTAVTPPADGKKMR